MDEKDCLEIIVSKTALLFEAAAILGADRKKNPGLHKKLGGLGRSIGTAYQIADDWLDYAGAAGTLGKDTLNDLSEGKVTLPLLCIRRNLGKNERLALDSLIGKGKIDPSAGALVKRLLDKSPAGTEMFRLLKSYERKSLNIIGGFPESSCKTSLQNLSLYITERAFFSGPPVK